MQGCMLCFCFSGLASWIGLIQRTAELCEQKWGTTFLEWPKKMLTSEIPLVCNDDVHKWQLEYWIVLTGNPTPYIHCIASWRAILRVNCEKLDNLSASYRFIRLEHLYFQLVHCHCGPFWGVVLSAGHDALPDPRGKNHFGATTWESFPVPQ